MTVVTNNEFNALDRSTYGLTRDETDGVVPFPAGTLIEIRVITDKAMTNAELVVTIDKAP